MLGFIFMFSYLLGLSFTSEISYTDITFNCSDPFIDINRVEESLVDCSPCSIQTSHNQSLTLGIFVKTVQYSNISYFRADPLLLTCIRRVNSKFFTPNIINYIYLPNSIDQLPNPKTDNLDVNEVLLLYHHQAGLAASLYNIENTTSNLVEEVINSCWDLFAINRRYLGLVMLNDNKSVDILIKCNGSYFPQLFTEVNEILVKFLTPATEIHCNASREYFEIGETFPPNIQTPVNFVGDIESAIYRFDNRYSSLRHYPANNANFTDCDILSSNYFCPNRVMSIRLYQGIKMLIGVLHSSSINLTVAYSWSENNLPNFTCNHITLNSSLFQEGRASLLQSTTNNSYLAAYASCVGFDYVSYFCKYVLVAVRKQRSIRPINILFPGYVLFPIDSDQINSGYQMPNSVFYPLFDSSGIQEFKLSPDFKVDDFISRDFSSRYFMIAPLLLKCLQATKDTFTQLYNDSLRIIIDGYIHNNDSTGWSVEIYDTKNNTLSSSALYRIVIKSCLPLLTNYNSYSMYFNNLIIGLYGTLLISESITKWNLTSNNYIQTTELVYFNSVNTGRDINPIFKNYLCDSTSNIDNYNAQYSIKNIESIIPPYSGLCVPNIIDSSFCLKSTSSRNIIINQLLNIISRKHSTILAVDFKNSINGCFGQCDYCKEGHKWNLKKLHCNRLVQWTPYDLLSDVNNIHFYVQDTKIIQKLACGENRYCIDKSPLFSIFVPFMYALFRPEPHRAKELYIYDSHYNPNPIIEELFMQFAYDGQGNATVWIKDEKDLFDLESSLVVLMVYNANIALVEIILYDSSRLINVIVQMESNIRKWSTIRCPNNARDIIAPYHIRSL